MKGVCVTIDGVELTSRIVGKAVVISIKGSILVSEVAKLQSLFTQLMNKGHKHFIIDLEHTRILQSHVISQILKMIQESSRHGGTFCLVKPSERVHFVLNLTRVSDLVPVYESLDDAMENSYF